MLMIMYHIAPCTSCIASFLLSSYMDRLPLGHMYAEPKLEEPTEQAQVEEFTNLVWIKASPIAFNYAPYLLISILLYVLL
jgi:hypothetical protein